MEIGSRIAAVSAAVVLLPGVVEAHATVSVAPTLLVMVSHIGWEVDAATRGKICTVASGDECRSRHQSGAAGGFSYPGSVATDARTGDLYVADIDNYRIQKLTASGVFIAMFGWDVNRTRDAQAAVAQAEKSVCTAASGDRCTAGVPGAAAGQLANPLSVAVDPATGAVYVLEFVSGDSRVDKYTAGGRFVWMIGKHVNATTRGNICSEREVEVSGVRCEAGEESTSAGTEHAAFKFAPQYGDLLAAGGPERLLYVGDEHRVQEFDGAGRWKREILLASLSAEAGSGVASLAVDSRGDLYLMYRVAGAESVDVVREFGPNGEELGQFRVNPRLPNTIVHVDGIAIDSSGRMAAIGVELGPGFYQRFGFLYEADTGRLIGEFAPPSDNDGLTFDGKGDLYVAATDDHEVVAYVPAPVSGLVTSPVACEVGPESDRSNAFECALSRGTV